MADKEIKLGLGLDSSSLQSDLKTAEKQIKSFVNEMFAEASKVSQLPTSRLTPRKMQNIQGVASRAVDLRSELGNRAFTAKDSKSASAYRALMNSLVKATTSFSAATRIATARVKEKAKAEREAEQASKKSSAETERATKALERQIEKEQKAEEQAGRFTDSILKLTAIMGFLKRILNVVTKSVTETANAFEQNRLDTNRYNASISSLNDSLKESLDITTTYFSALGYNKSMIQSYTADMISFAKSLNMSDIMSANLATRFLELSAVLSKGGLFSNFEEAADDIKSFLETGRATKLTQALNIKISDDQLKKFAKEKKLIDDISVDMDENVKYAARIAYLSEAVSKNTELAAKHENTLLQDQEELRNSWQSLKETIGSITAGPLNIMVQFVNVIVKGINGTVEAFSRVNQRMGGTLGIVGGVAVGFVAIATASLLIATAVARVNVLLNGLPKKLANTLSYMISIASILASITMSVVGLISLLETLKETEDDNSKKAFNISTAFEDTADSIEEAKSQLMGFDKLNVLQEQGGQETSNINVGALQSLLASQEGTFANLDIDLSKSIEQIDQMNESLRQTTIITEAVSIGLGALTAAINIVTFALKLKKKAHDDDNNSAITESITTTTHTKITKANGDVIERTTEKKIVSSKRLQTQKRAEAATDSSTTSTEIANATKSATSDTIASKTKRSNSRKNSLWNIYEAQTGFFKANSWIPIIGAAIAGAAIISMFASLGSEPGLATGGVVSSPTRALIGEGKYSEAVVPLGKSPQFAEMKSSIAQEVVNSLGGGTSGPIEINLTNKLDLDGREIYNNISRQTYDATGKTLEQIARRV